MKILWHSDIKEVRGFNTADEESGLTRGQTYATLMTSTEI